MAEPWITPSIFEQAGDSAVDEYTLGAAGFNLQNHWATWITEQDFANIAAAGLNHVRIPIGYWSVYETAPFNFGAIDYLDQAINWARNHGIKVLIDLHGASVSQNGFDNSGKFGNVEWGSQESYAATLNAVGELAQRYKGATDVVSAIEALNEPLLNQGTGNIQLGEIQQFYRDAWGRIHNDASSDLAVFVHDAFQGSGAWGDWGNDLQLVGIDVHTYYIFNNDQLAQSNSDRLGSVCAKKSEYRSSNKWTIVGEWSSAMTDCAKYLNGRYRGARTTGSYDGNGPIGRGNCDGLATGGVAALPDDYKSAIRQFNEAQLDAYEGRTGWFYWTWKTEGAGEWDMQDQLAHGLFPSPPTSRQYGTQCP